MGDLRRSRLPLIVRIRLAWHVLRVGDSRPAGWRGCPFCGQEFRADGHGGAVMGVSAAYPEGVDGPGVFGCGSCGAPLTPSDDAWVRELRETIVPVDIVDRKSGGPGQWSRAARRERGAS